MARLFRFAPVLILFVIWEAISRLGLVPVEMLPPLPIVFAAFRELLVSGDLLTNAVRSLSRAAAGLAAAVAVGIFVGLFMATFRPFRLLVNPVVQIFYPMPRSALIPVVMIWFGLGDSSKIFLIFLGCLLPVVVSSYNGARGVNPFVIWSASSLGASKGQVLREIVLPAAAPEILSGCRAALAFAFILMVSSEFLIAQDGLGFLISSLGDGGLYPGMFAVIFFVAATGFVADQLYAAFARRQLAWRES